MSKTEETSKALTKVGESYAALSCPKEELKGILQQNIRGSVNEFMLDRVNVPTGGGSSWEIPSLSGIEQVKEIEGIIVAIKYPRTYWQESFDESGGGSPPDCYSDDGLKGVGAPGGQCQICPLNKWKSADKGTGKACRENAILFILRNDDYLPITVKIPPSSLGAFGKYTLRLASRRDPSLGAPVSFSSVVTRLRLDKATKKGTKIEYSCVVPEMVARLNKNESETIRSYIAGIQPLVSVSSEEVFEGDGKQ